MPTERLGIGLHQLKADALNQYIEERIRASYQVTAIISALAESVPDFAESYQRHLASQPVTFPSASDPGASGHG
jgi:hypothetical protein